jgi:RHS repeat-associated protein
MDGEIVERFAYSPFGELLTQPTHDTPFLFNGQYGVMTDANDLYYMRARFYSPDLRRFINQDILLGNIADGQSLNRFAYVTGNPISFIDPFGLDSVAIEISFINKQTDKFIRILNSLAN